MAFVLADRVVHLHIEWVNSAYNKRIDLRRRTSRVERRSHDATMHTVFCRCVCVRVCVGGIKRKYARLPCLLIFWIRTRERRNRSGWIERSESQFVFMQICMTFGLSSHYHVSVLDGPQSLRQQPWAYFATWAWSCAPLWSLLWHPMVETDVMHSQVDVHSGLD